MFLFVPEQRLDGGQARSAFEHVGGKRMPQRVRGGVGKIQLLASLHDQALNGTQRHRIRGLVHSLAQRFFVVVTSSGIGK